MITVRHAKKILKVANQYIATFAAKLFVNHVQKVRFHTTANHMFVFVKNVLKKVRISTILTVQSAKKLL